MIWFQKKVVVTTTSTTASSVAQNKENVLKPWFLSGGTEYPTNFQGTPKLFPDEDDGDRIAEQLMYVPEDYEGKHMQYLFLKQGSQNFMLVHYGSLNNIQSINK